MNIYFYFHSSIPMYFLFLFTIYSLFLRWQIGFCGVAKKQNEEEDQTLDVEETKKRQADLYFVYSVNGGILVFFLIFKSHT